MGRAAAGRQLLILIKAGRRTTGIGTSDSLSGWIEERLQSTSRFPPVRFASSLLSAFTWFSSLLRLSFSPALKLPTQTEIFAESPALCRHHALNWRAIIRHRNAYFLKWRRPFFRGALRVLIANCSQFARNSETTRLISTKWQFVGNSILLVKIRILDEIKLISKHEPKTYIVHTM